MLAGPATNIATLGVVGKELGRQSLVAYLIGVIGTAMLFGGALDIYLNYFDINIREGLQQHSHIVSAEFSQLAALVLTVLIARVGFDSIKNKLYPAQADDDAELLKPQ